MGGGQCLPKCVPLGAEPEGEFSIGVGVRHSKFSKFSVVVPLAPQKCPFWSLFREYSGAKVAYAPPLWNAIRGRGQLPP